MMRWLRYAERSFWVAGILLLVAYVSFRAHGTFSKQTDLRRFHEARDTVQTALATSGDGVLSWDGTQSVDFALWSDSRIRHYQESLTHDFDLPLAILRIPSIDLEVPVLEGTDELSLNRAVGHIGGTARPGEGGNVGIAGHRDGFFRGLKDIGIGDSIDLITLTRSEHYVVDDLLIVDPSQTQVLRHSREQMITLVTCYPFYYVGKAPQRFIVRAIRLESG